MPVSSTVGVEDEPENSNRYGSMEEYESDVRKRRHSEEFEDTLAKSKEVLNHSTGLEASAHPSLSATVVSKPWMEIQVPVRLVNLNILNIVCDMEQDKEPVISLPIRSMPTYTGAGRTLTYLHEQRLWEAAKKKNKITAFFKPKPRAHPLSPPSPSPPESIISILDSPSDPVASKTSAPSSDLDSSHSPMVIALEGSDSNPEIRSVCTLPTPGHDSDADDMDSEPKDVRGMSPIRDHVSVDSCHDTSTLSFLDVTDEDTDNRQTESVLDTIKRLTVDAKKYKSFNSLFHLNALEQFVEMWGKYQHNPKIKGLKMKASHTIAVSVRRGQYFAQKLRSMYTYVERYHTLPPEGKGKHHAYPTLLNNEQIAAAVRWYLTVLADGEVSISGTQNNMIYLPCFKITPLHLMQQVNGVIIPSLGLDTGGQQISESTARRWLTKLSYELKDVKKGIYIDGHEREDVVAYRSKFLKEFGENERYLMIRYCDCQLTDHRLRWTYRDDDLEPIKPNLGPGELLHVPIFHDESIFQVNELPRQVWVHDGRMPL